MKTVVNDFNQYEIKLVCLFSSVLVKSFKPLGCRFKKDLKLQVSAGFE